MCLLIGQLPLINRFAPRNADRGSRRVEKEKRRRERRSGRLCEGRGTWWNWEKMEEGTMRMRSRSRNWRPLAARRRGAPVLLARRVCAAAKARRATRRRAAPPAAARQTPPRPPASCSMSAPVPRPPRAARPPAASRVWVLYKQWSLPFLNANNCKLDVRRGPTAYFLYTLCFDSHYSALNVRVISIVRALLSLSLSLSLYKRARLPISHRCFSLRKFFNSS